MLIQSPTSQPVNPGFPTGTPSIDAPSDPTGPGAGSAASGAPGPTPDAATDPQKSSSVSLVSAGDVPADTEAAAARIEAAVKEIEASASNSLDSLDLLAKVMIQQNGLQRHAALEDRMAARQSAMTDLMTEAKSMTKEASQMKTAAVVSLVVGAVSAGLAFAGSVGSAIRSIKNIGHEAETATKLSGLTKDLRKIQNEEKTLAQDFKTFIKEGPNLAKADQRAKLVKQAEQIKTDIGELKAEMKTEKKFTTLFEGLGHGAKAGESSGKFVDGNVGSQNKLLEAQQKTDEAQSQNQGSVEDQMKTTQQALTDMGTQILSFLHDMQEAKAEGMAAFTRA